MTQLPRPVRRGFLIAHVVTSVGWLGLTLCLLVLAVAGATAERATADAAYLAMGIFGDWLLAPLALASIGTGLVLSVGTPWGLLRHRWVVVKLLVSLVAATASLLAFRTSINEAADAVAAGERVTDASSLLAPPCVSLTLYLFLTAVSYLKPWGLTRRGQRHRERERRERLAARDRGQKPLAAASPGRPG
ncbi:DUF2269 domain-containing protein [Streptomyces sp. B6B3]|uniref:DUF2269 domain-containing protein n=1 Tax=Streptomyces sp. B6B3 TaxID=3153570 RepID=UPI00325F34BF